MKKLLKKDVVLKYFITLYEMSRSDFVMYSKILSYLDFPSCFLLCIINERIDTIEYTDVQECLNTLLVTCYNDLLDRQSSGRDRDEVRYFYIGDVFVNIY